MRPWRAWVSPRLRRRLRRLRHPVFWGNLRSLRPRSADFGFSRGTPVDRYYMQGFLAEQRDAVRGVVGEVAGATYAETFGGSEVERIEVIDLAPGPRTTRVADIGTTGSLPEGTYDCLIVTQVMQYVPDVAASIGNLIRALRPGGTLLLAVPALTPHDARESLDGDYWRFWPAGLAHLLATAAPRSPRSVVGYGNLLATTAFLHGVAAEELKPSELSRQDERFPVVVCARVDAPPEGPTVGAGL